MRYLLKIFFTLLLFSNLKAQLLFYQDTYKGGVTSDGVSYHEYDYLQPDTINFQLHIPVGSTIKKAYLLSMRVHWYSINEAHPLLVNFNNNILPFDSSEIVTNKFNCSISDQADSLWMVAKDVTSLVQVTGNRLITPDQVNLTSIYPNGQYAYYSFVLIVMYENLSFPSINAVIFINNQTYNANMIESLSDFNPVSTNKDVGLSIWTGDVTSFPSDYTLSYALNSSVGNFNLGTLNQYTVVSGNNVWKKTLPGSFYYENNSLFGLVDDTPDPFINNTDALANIKNYIANGATSFSLTSVVGNGLNGCEDIRGGYFLAYTTPCPSRSNKDTTLVYHICRGSNPVTLAVNSNTVNSTYGWYSADGSLSTATTASVIVTPTVTTNYVAYVDSAGCKHTEHFKVSVYNLPQIDSIYTTDIICGNNNILGVATVKAYNGTKPYQYSTVGTNQASPTFSNIPVGTYTVSVTDSLGCQSTQKTFSIKQVNIAQVNFTAQPDTACAPASIYFNNTSNTNFNEWYVNGDSINAQNLNYTFTDTGTYHVTLIGWRNLRMCSDTLTKSVHVKDCPPDSIHITVPNIFSPNADGINDSWQLVISSYQYTVSNYQCTVYDRWGIKVFETSTLSQAWDGRSTGGLACSAGAYFYIIKLTATNSKGVIEQKDFKGYLELVR